MKLRFHPGWAAVPWIVAALGWTFRDLIFRGFIIAQGDVPDQFLPWREFTAEEIGQGRIPLWNPYSFCGAPFLANMQSCVLYPVDRILDLFFPPGWAMSIGLVFHLLLGAVSLHFLAIRFGAGAACAALAAAGYSLGGFHAIHLLGGNLLTITSSTYLPAHLLVISALSDRLQKGERVGSLPFWGAFLVALQVLSGHAQMTFYNGVFAGVFALAQMALMRHGRAALLLHHVLIWGVGALLAAPQLLPSLEYSRLSSRTESLPYEAATEFSFGWEVLPTLFLPEYLGSRVDGFRPPGRDTFWGSWRNWSAVYIGIIPVCGFVFLILSRATRRARAMALKAFAPLLLVGLFLALGRNNPLYRLVHELPLFGQFRAPSKYLPGFIAPFTVLAAVGLSSLLDKLEQARSDLSRGAVMAASVALPAILVASVAMLNLQRIWPEGIVTPLALFLWNLARSLSLALLALLGWMALGKLSAPQGSRLWANAPTLFLLAVAFLDSDAYHSRYILSAPAEWVRTFPTELVKKNLPEGERVLLTPDYLRQNDPVPRRIPSASGYDPFQLGVFVDTFRAEGYLSKDLIPDSWAPSLDWARRLGVGVVLSTTAQRHRDLSPLALERPFFLYKVANPAPLVEFQGHDQAPPRSSPFRCRWEDGALHVTGTAPTDGRLVIRQVYAPGWRAVDPQGSMVEVELAEPFWQSIAITAGEVALTLKYEPWGWTWGLRLFPLALLVWMALGWAGLKAPGTALHKDPPSH